MTVILINLGGMRVILINLGGMAVICRRIYNILNYIICLIIINIKMTY